ncbi:MAG: DUF4230 domain-containing protein [Phycisphaerales bacterium]
MPILDPSSFILVLCGVTIGAAAVWYVSRRWRRGRPAGPKWRDDRVDLQMIADRVRSVGKLVALEVSAKEIATASAGWSWLPPLIFNQAKLAMIFHFEKQYWVDLACVRPEDVQTLGPGKYRLSLPAVEGRLRLTNMTPYDIQSARVLGLLDLIPMTADRQKELMDRAQHQASSLFEAWDARYHAEARAAAERQIHTLFGMMGVVVECEWPAEKSIERPAESPATKAASIASVARPRWKAFVAKWSAA